MAQDFLPYDIWPGQDLDATKIQRNFEAIEAKYPLRGADVSEVFGSTINWSGSTIPSDAINVDELFNNATGVARALGCLDVISGMRLQYDTATTFRVLPGHILHRSEFKVREDPTTCHDGGVDPGSAITPGNVLIPGECAQTEGNPSGLDYGVDVEGVGGTWYFVYAKLDIAGSEPEVRVSADRPVWCPGKGPEHPDNNKLRFIGSLRTMAGGAIRPFTAAANGWTYWPTAAAASNDQSGGFIHDGTEIVNGTDWARYEQGATGSDYHHGPKHIPCTADAVLVAISNTANKPKNRTYVRSILEPGDGYSVWGNKVSGGIISSDETVTGDAVVRLPVNKPGIETLETQKFEVKSSTAGTVDVAAYHEPFLA